jgi:hypothetical protein
LPSGYGESTWLCPVIGRGLLESDDRFPPKIALDRPQGKRIPRFKVEVAMINQVKATFTIPTKVGFVLESEHIECS